MNKRITLVVVAVVVLALLAGLGFTLLNGGRKVTVKTGEIVICTAGEIIEDNTEDITVSEKEVADYGVTTRVITCDEHGDLSALYEAAQHAIEIGDLVTARERLQTIVNQDPSYRNAKAQLDAINSGQRPDPDTSGQTAGNGNTGTGDTGTGDTGTGDTGAELPTGPVVSLTKWVPDSIAGYVAQGILADAASLSRQYIPTGGAANQLMIEVEQRVDAGAATSAQQSLVAAYPTGSATRTIAGRTVLAGANGPYAIAVFTDGSLTVAVELHATSGSGTALIDAAFAVVESITK